MPPKKPTPRSDELFRSHLDNVIGMEHAPVRLARLIDRSRFDEAYGRSIMRRAPRAVDPVDGRLAPAQAHGGPVGRGCLRTWLCLLDRDIGRKVAGNAEFGAAFAVARERVAKILTQKTNSTYKLSALHVPEVECIAKGKARTH